MSLRHKVGTIAGTMAVSLAFFPGLASAQTLSFNQQAASYVETFPGQIPYTYGGNSPSTGFDCSGLSQYVYGHLGKSIPRTAEEQFLSSRPESESAAWGGDLVFFHVSSDPSSYVYHVGIYIGNGQMVDAPETGEDVKIQTIYELSLLGGGRVQ